MLSLKLGVGAGANINYAVADASSNASGGVQRALKDLPDLKDRKSIIKGLGLSDSIQVDQFSISKGDCSFALEDGGNPELAPKMDEVNTFCRWFNSLEDSVRLRLIHEVFCFEIGQDYTTGEPSDDVGVWTYRFTQDGNMCIQEKVYSDSFLVRKREQ